MKENRFVLCDSCESKIYLGSEFYCFDGYCGVYCSAKCFAEAHATTKVLDEEEADNCGCEILDDNAIENKITETSNQINELEKVLDYLKKRKESTYISIEEMRKLTNK